MTMDSNHHYAALFKIRTITGFFQIHESDFLGSIDETRTRLQQKIQRVATHLRRVKNDLQTAGYEVQTLRLATNPFGKYLTSENMAVRLSHIDQCLQEQIDIFACALGPARTEHEVENMCATIVTTSPRLSCSAELHPSDILRANSAARCIQQIAKTNPLGNFQFCVAMSANDKGIPFFPIASAGPATHCENQNKNAFHSFFAIGLENGTLVRQLLEKTRSIEFIPSVFRDGMLQALTPLQNICNKAARADFAFQGIDTSLNPSLDPMGSVAGAIEQIIEVSGWAQPGTLAVAAAITQTIQSLPGIQTSGYCGIMLPVCEDHRLAELSNELRITDLLHISNVCGVGIDTVPIPGNFDTRVLALRLLDVAALAHRWKKPLSCRVFPVPGKEAGERTQFDFPHLINATILSLSS